MILYVYLLLIPKRDIQNFKIFYFCAFVPRRSRGGALWQSKMSKRISSGDSKRSAASSPVPPASANGVNDKNEVEKQKKKDKRKKKR